MKSPVTNLGEDTVRFGPFIVGTGGQGAFFLDRPLPLEPAAAVVFASLVGATGASVAEGLLINSLGARGHGCDNRQVWACVAMINSVLEACCPEDGYVAQCSPHAFQLVLPPHRRQAPVMLGLPVRTASVVGFAGAIESLTDLLQQHRCVSIVAAGGMGKTTLAIVFANTVLPNFWDGACFIDLAPMADARLLPNVLASALGIAASPTGTLHAAFAYLREKDMLLVLDSCEHVVAGVADMVEKLLRAAPGLRILATTREPLRVTSEWQFRHAPMRLPDSADSLRADTASEYPAVQLFVERAAGDGFGIDDDNAALVCDICRRLDGIPLAIELAAARVCVLGIATLAAQLEQRLLASEPARRSASSRHDTLSAMLEWSFDLLTPMQRDVLIRLTLYRGEFTLDAATDLLAGSGCTPADALDSVLELVAKSLVVRLAHKEERLRLLDTTRAWASKKLDRANQQNALMLRHAHYLCRLLERADVEWTDMERRAWLERYQPWIDDIRCALEWAFSAEGDAVLAIRLVVASFSLGHMASFTAEFTEYMNRCLRLLESGVAPELVDATRMRSLLCHIHTRVGDDEAIIADTLQSICAEGPDSPLAQYRTALATAWWASAFVPGNYPAALERADFLGLQVPPGADAVIDLISCRTSAQALHYLGQHDEAAKRADKVVTNAWRKIPLRFNPSPVDVHVSMRIILGRIAWMQGRADQAQVIAADCLHYAASDTAVALAQALAMLSIPIALWRGDADAAHHLVERLILHGERHSLDYWLQWGVRYRQVLRVMADDDAFHLLALPMAAAFETMQRDHFVTFDPRLLADDSIMRVEDGTVGWCAAEMLRAKALPLARTGQHADAEALLQRSLDIARQQGTLGWELRSAASLAQLWSQQDRGYDARSLLAPVVARLSQGAGTADVCSANALLERL